MRSSRSGDFSRSSAAAVSGSDNVTALVFRRLQRADAFFLQRLTFQQQLTEVGLDDRLGHTQFDSGLFDKRSPRS